MDAVRELRIVCVDGREEVARDEAVALVEQLVERVLPVGARLSPHHRPRLVVARQVLVQRRRLLAVALHKYIP